MNSAASTPAASHPTVTAPVLPSAGRLRPLSVSAVRLEPGFWGDRQRLNTEAIIPHAAEWMDRLGWVGNLTHAHGTDKYEHRGREFADSEVYKLIEAISWDAARGERPSDDLLESLLEAVLGSQDPDGYLHTLFGRAWQRPRYSDFQWGHELYCFGHLIQSAVAHHRAYGDDRFLATARKLADHVCTMFGPDGLDHVCGHAEIEVALVELFRETGERRYLDQASVFVERRGTGTLPLFEFGQAYWQDEMPVRAATVLRGHAVRALYLAAGAVDVAIETEDAELLEALMTQWDNTVAKRTYITGGMGSHHMDEAFGDDYVLPPDRSYCETCAGVASIMFSWRLLLATGDSKYADLIERTLYNVVATSPSPDGRSFFYANTLHQRVEHTPPPLNEDGVVIRGGAAGRQPWFEVSCCPPNLARTLASLGAYIATGDERSVQIHQYASADIRVGKALLRVTTEYPADGKIAIEAVETLAEGVEVGLRIPSWAVGATVSTSGTVEAAHAGGSHSIRLRRGETAALELPMEVRVARPDERVDAIRGTVAFERGPEVYALESVDLPTGVTFEGVAVDDHGEYRNGELHVELTSRPSENHAWPFDAPRAGAAGTTQKVRLTRYHEWAQRGPSLMRIWIPLGRTDE